MYILFPIVMSLVKSHRVIPAPILPSILYRLLKWKWWSEKWVLLQSRYLRLQLSFPPECKKINEIQHCEDLKVIVMRPNFTNINARRWGLCRIVLRLDWKWKVLAGLSGTLCGACQPARKVRKWVTRWTMMVISQEGRILIAPVVNWEQQTLKVVLLVSDFYSPCNCQIVKRRQGTLWLGGRLTQQWYVTPLHLCPWLNLSLPRDSYRH